MTKKCEACEAEAWESCGRIAGDARCERAQIVEELRARRIMQNLPCAPQKVVAEDRRVPRYRDKCDAHDFKPTNPKDAAATSRIPLALLSPVAKIAWAVAQYAGMLKYGAWNWRKAGVRASVYISALERHIDAYKSGEEYDPVDGSPHLGNIMACAAILLDAKAAGKLTDDRGPALSHRQAVAEGEATMTKLREQYADKNPRHWTIADGDDR